MDDIHRHPKGIGMRHILYFLPYGTRYECRHCIFVPDGVYAGGFMPVLYRWDVCRCCIVVGPCRCYACRIYES